MQQYLDHLKAILERGSDKGEAREGLLPTRSLFGYQWRHNLADGFPLVTTKKMFWKGIVVELLWFLKGDTNVKFLNDNGVTFWNEDAYNYYIKRCKDEVFEPLDFDNFVKAIQEPSKVLIDKFKIPTNYTLGDCGKQYGWLWRNLEGQAKEMDNHYDNPKNCIKRAIELLKEEGYHDNSQTLVELNDGLESLNEEVRLVEYSKSYDQFKELLEGLVSNPTGRRHIIDAWNPPTLNEMALHPCHCLVQFNCRPIPWELKLELAKRNPSVEMENLAITEAAAGDTRFGFVPQYYLDCQMYQRSADMFLGVPLNVASYALLTHLICQLVGMEPGEMIYTYGDSHIYGNVREEAELQLTREPKQLPRLNINTEFWPTQSGSCGEGPLSIEGFLKGLDDDNFISSLINEDIQLSKYNFHPAIDSRGKLLTGAKMDIKKTAS